MTIKINLLNLGEILKSLDTNLDSMRGKRRSLPAGIKRTALDMIALIQVILKAYEQEKVFPDQSEFKHLQLSRAKLALINQELRYLRARNSLDSLTATNLITDIRDAQDLIDKVVWPTLH